MAERKRHSLIERIEKTGPLDCMQKEPLPDVTSHRNFFGLQSRGPVFWILSMSECLFLSATGCNSEY